MSLTNMNRESRRPVRSVGVRDLRFAGAVAAGLVAGVIGVGALSAPLLGWTDWPDGLKPGGSDVVKMKPPAQQVAAADQRRDSTRRRSRGRPGRRHRRRPGDPGRHGRRFRRRAGARARRLSGTGAPSDGDTETAGGDGFVDPNLTDSDGDSHAGRVGGALRPRRDDQRPRRGHRRRRHPERGRVPPAHVSARRRLRRRRPQRRATPTRTATASGT